MSLGPIMIGWWLPLPNIFTILGVYGLTVCYRMSCVLALATDCIWLSRFVLIGSLFKAIVSLSRQGSTIIWSLLKAVVSLLRLGSSVPRTCTFSKTTISTVSLL